MKDIEYVELSQKIINELYIGKSENYFNYVDDNILWIGPKEDLVFSGREELIRREKNNPSNNYFVINSIHSKVIRTSVNTAEVILFFKVFSSSGNGDLFEHKQRIQLSWVTRQIVDENGTTLKVPRIAVSHISNIPIEEEISKEVRLSESIFLAPSAFVQRNSTMERIQISAADKSTMFLLPETIIYVESCDNGQHCFFYLADRKVLCIEKLSSIAKKYSHLLLKIHESYLVNPIYVIGIKRFEITLVNGQTLPVPERKYTGIKSSLSEFFDSKNRQISIGDD